MAANSNGSARNIFVFRKSNVDAKVDRWKAPAGLSIGNCAARFCPTTILELAALRAIYAMHGRKAPRLLKAATAQFSG